MIRDPQRVHALAAERLDENWRFRTFLKHHSRISDARLNRVARELGARAAADMDCTTCGACCRVSRAPVTQRELSRLAKTVSLPVLEFRARYIAEVKDEVDAENGPHLHAPCRLLDGNRCSVYEQRPKACRDYPYVDKPVRPRMIGIIERAGVCPIVFEQLEQLKDEVGFRRSLPRPPRE